MTEDAPARRPPAEQLMDLYRVALPEVYGFLLARCGDATVAEDLTAETFMDAVSAVRNGSVDTITIGWLIVVARRRLVDHWRRLEREQRGLRLVRGGTDDSTDPWDEVIDVEAARSALELLAPNHRTVLVLRYLDGLSVPDIAELLELSVHAVEGRLQRARAALRRVYQEATHEA